MVSLFLTGIGEVDTGAKYIRTATGYVSYYDYGSDQSLVVGLINEVQNSVKFYCNSRHIVKVT
jgi:hypothetical protein